MNIFFLLLLLSSSLASRSIRQIDFQNFRFPLSGGSETTVRAVNGKTPKSDLMDPADTRITAVEVFYADLTGDGQDEAIVAVYHNGGGHGAFRDILVYSISSAGLVLLGHFPDGDRANGGLIDVCVLHSQLVLVRQSSNSCATCVEGIQTDRFVWSEKEFRLAARRVIPVKSEQPPPGFVTVCKHRPYARGEHRSMQ